MNKEKNQTKFSYESEADVFSWEVSRKPIDFAEEVGNIVVHFDKKHDPVLIEILEASKFLATAEKLVRSRTGVTAKKIAVATQ